MLYAFAACTGYNYQPNSNQATCLTCGTGNQAFHFPSRCVLPHYFVLLSTQGRKAMVDRQPAAPVSAAAATQEAPTLTAAQLAQVRARSTLRDVFTSHVVLLRSLPKRPIQVQLWQRAVHQLLRNRSNKHAELCLVELHLQRRFGTSFFPLRFDCDSSRRLRDHEHGWRHSQLLRVHRRQVRGRKRLGCLRDLRDGLERKRRDWLVRQHGLQLQTGANPLANR